MTVVETIPYTYCGFMSSGQQWSHLKSQSKYVHRGIIHSKSWKSMPYNTA